MCIFSHFFTLNLTCLDNNNGIVKEEKDITGVLRVGGNHCSNLSQKSQEQHATTMGILFQTKIKFLGISLVAQRLGLSFHYQGPRFDPWLRI